MGYQQGTFLGCYVPDDLKARLRKRAAKAHRSLSQEVIRILTQAVYGRAVPFADVKVDRVVIDMVRGAIEQDGQDSENR